MKTVVSWWSAGITSAVACKLAIDKYGKDNVLIYYFKIDSAHKDNERFKAECEAWYGKEIIEVQSDKYRDQFEVIEKTRYINGAAGARCTKELKKELRFKIERDVDYDAQIFGFEFHKKEVNRALRFIEQYPDAKGEFPLIENQLTKAQCLYIVEQAGIKKPAMYELGYPNNNCIGCVKGGQGYWNKIRVDFPDAFARMSRLESDLGRACLKKDSKPLFLSELDENAGRGLKIVMPDCGSFCDLEFTEFEHDLLSAVMNNGQLMLDLY